MLQSMIWISAESRGYYSCRGSSAQLMILSNGGKLQRSGRTERQNVGSCSKILGAHDLDCGINLQMFADGESIRW